MIWASVLIQLFSIRGDFAHPILPPEDIGDVWKHLGCHSLEGGCCFIHTEMLLNHQECVEQPPGQGPFQLQCLLC